ncbi:RDD family protein [Thermoanaerobacterium sp. R66]|uniref:RDD family protein n=1 Tax=Thermoanaerobacterium sp. R66 TaxID=2742479 RepID=UPI0023808B17|nr:RDD family protein [Thermoanaerobacterium sp. R66]MDE4542903.1 RDD family protein [Thermoanaerobacterium sp. R66]
MKYAGFWRRFIAFLVDYIVIVIAEMILLLIFGVILQLTGNVDKSSSQTDTAIGMFILIVLIVGNWLYYSLMESSNFQGTLGKVVLNIKVTDYDGKKISFKKATIRYFSKILSTLIIFIGFAMAGWTRYKQALHDIIAGTFVIKS